jgi:hypothetical protein
MYLADAIGYLGYAAVMLARNFAGTLDNFLSFFVPLSWLIAATGMLLLVPCWFYFDAHGATRSPAELEAIRA